MRAVRFVLLFVLCVFGTAAWAADFNGTFQGSGTAAGTTLKLTQDAAGTVVGKLSGTSLGTLQAQTRDGARMDGTLTTDGITYTFWGDLSDPNLLITLYDNEGNQVMYAFSEATAGPTSTTMGHRLAAPPSGLR